MPRVPGYKTVSGPALAAAAPRIRATAGVGTAGQKTWNLRRPVTVVGSGRNATITLSGPSVAKAHCAIINTGRSVLLKNLSGPKSTVCNGKPVNLATLNDGDVIQIDTLRIQVAIQGGKDQNEKTGIGIAYEDPLRASHPFLLRRPDQSGEWRIEEAVCVIGRQPGLAVQLDDQEVSLAHAILFECDGQLALCDLGSRTGTWLNGERQTLAFVASGAKIRVGGAEFEYTDPTLNPNGSNNDAPSCNGDLERWQNELDSRERRLNAREKALNSRLKELKEYEEALRRREEHLQQSGRRGNETTSHGVNAGVHFAELALSAQSFPDDSDVARQAIDRAWRILNRAAEHPPAPDAVEPTRNPGSQGS